MITIIAINELKNLFRESRYKMTVLLLVVLFALSIITQHQAVKKLNRERAAAQESSREAWLQQSPKNPHSAAHFGNFAFRLKTPLSLFDNGLDTYTGAYVYLEPHKQDDFKFAPAEDNSALIRIGELTPSFILQTILPLLILFLCFGSITQERERGTLKVLLNQNVSMAKLVAGKSLCYWIAIAIPVTILSIIAISLMPALEDKIDFMFASFLLTSVYLLYIAFIVIISVMVSARSSSGRVALMKLLCLWLAACILLPKLCSNIGSTIYETPSQQQFADLVEADEKNGLNGHDPLDKRRDQLLKATLRQYHVDTITDLPVNFDAIAMIESEKYTTQVYRKRIAEIQDVFTRQNAIGNAVAFINPFQNVQYLSRALCRTDYEAFKSFQQQAEDYRLYFVNEMNGFMASHTKSGDWKTQFGQETYTIVKPFKYNEPPIEGTLKKSLVFITAFTLWIVFCCILIKTTNKITLA